MAEAASKEEDSFTCPVCLDLLKDPVSIPCGHNFCMGCINGCWDQEDQKGVFSCPLCKRNFTPRPVLFKNPLIAEMVEKFGKTRIQAADPALATHGPGDVECDVCTERKLKAVKSCLECLMSYCETHFKVHNDLHRSRKHTVIDATRQIQERICSHHNKVLEIFCRTDQSCICYLCTMDKHKGHDTVIALEERTDKHKQMGQTQRRFQQRIQEREKELQELRKAVKTLKSFAQIAVENSERIFTEMIRSIERRRSEVKELIRAQEKAEVERGERFLKQLEQEIAELKRRDAELEQLLHTKDHIHFLKSFQSIRDSPCSTNAPNMTINQIISFEAVKKIVSALKMQLQKQLNDIFKQDIAKISSAADTDPEDPIRRTSSKEKLPPYMSDVQAVCPEPKTREEFLQLSETSCEGTPTKFTVSKPSDFLNLVLLGKSGVGKSSCGNTILGKQVFQTRPPTSSEPVTLKPQIASGVVGNRNVFVIDTPELFSSQASQVELQKQIVTDASPGPCVFLLVLLPDDVGHNLEETLKTVQAAFGKKAADCTLALVTHSDHRKKSVAHFPEAIRHKIHFFDNTNQYSRQAQHLLSKIDNMLKRNEGFYFSQPLKTVKTVKLQRQFVHLAKQTAVQRQESTERHVAEGPETPRQFSSKLNEWLEREKQCSVAVTSMRPSLEDKLPLLPADNSPVSEANCEETPTQYSFYFSQTPKPVPAVKPKLQREFGRHLPEQTAVQRHEIKEGDVAEGFKTPHVCFSSYLKEWCEQEKKTVVDDVRLVLVGKTGAGKSATGNTILGNKEFKSSALMSSITKECEKRKIVIGSKMVHVIDTPGLLDTVVSSETIREEIECSISMASPGPHAFLLLIPVGRFTPEDRDTATMILEIFGENSKSYTIVGFTRGEELRDEGIEIEEYIERSSPALKELIAECSGWYHVFCNKDKDTQKQQAISLLDKIDKMIQQNGGSFFTNAKFEEAEKKIRAREMRLLQQRLEELELAYTGKETEVTFLASEITKIKLRLERKFKILHDRPQKETDEDMRKLEELQVKLERSQESGAMNLTEMKSIIFAELQFAREGIRERAERGEAKALAKGLRPRRDSCTIS